MTKDKYKKNTDNLQDDSPQITHQQCLTMLKELRALQQNIVPKCPLVFNDYTLSTFYRPSYFLSGDLIDYVVLDTHKIGILVFDVVGKGIPISLTTIWIKLLFQHLLMRPKNHAPKDTITQLNNSINRTGVLNKKGAFGFYGVLNTHTHTFTYCNFGIGVAKRYRGNHITALQKYGGPGLGMIDNTYTEGSIELKKKDILILSTDGIEDVQDTTGKRIGNQWLDNLVMHYSTIPHPKFTLIHQITQHIQQTTALEDDIGCVSITS